MIVLVCLKFVGICLCSEDVPKASWWTDENFDALELRGEKKLPSYALEEEFYTIQDPANVESSKSMYKGILEFKRDLEKEFAILNRLEELNNEHPMVHSRDFKAKRPSLPSGTRSIPRSSNRN